MVRSDPGSTINVRKALTNAAHAAGATVTGTGVSRDGWRRLLVIVETETMAATADSTITIETSDAVGGTYTPITDASFTLAATDDDSIFWGVVDLEQHDEFVLAEIVVGAGGTTAACGVTFVFFNPKDGSVDMTSGNTYTFSV